MGRGRKGLVIQNGKSKGKKYSSGTYVFSGMFSTSIRKKDTEPIHATPPEIKIAEQLTLQQLVNLILAN